MTPIRIQRSRQQKQVSPNGLPIVYVGRPSKWGNIYNSLSEVDKNKIVKLYKEYALRHFGSDKIQEELKGKNLSCWCKIGEPCHADILLKIANQKTIE